MFKALIQPHRVQTMVNGRKCQLMAGVSVAAALMEIGLLQTGCSLRRNRPKAPYCMMGVCFECELTIDGKSGTRACMTRVRDGMEIETGGGQ